MDISESTPEYDVQVVEQDFIESQVREQGLGPGPTTPARLVRYRHDWGDWKGSTLLKLNWNDISPDTVVMVAASQGLVAGDTVAGKFIGNAAYTVQNVAARVAGVDIRVFISWDSPINVQVDYLAALF